MWVRVGVPNSSRLRLALPRYRPFRAQSLLNVPYACMTVCLAPSRRVAAGRWCAGWRDGCAAPRWLCMNRWARNLGRAHLSHAAPPHTHAWPQPRACLRRPSHLCPTAQITPHDAFGQQMLINLESRGCALLGIHGARGPQQRHRQHARARAARSARPAACGAGTLWQHAPASCWGAGGQGADVLPAPLGCGLPAATPSLEAHRRRFTECGWQRAEAHDMDHVYRCGAGLAGFRWTQSL